MSHKKLALALAGLLLATCDSTETDGTKNCREDFDCAANEVCKDATADANGTCEQAATGADRTFGKLALDFSGGDEVYLVSVVSIPAGAEAIANSDIPFSLKGVADNASALRVAPLASQVSASSGLTGRSAFDAERHAQIARVARKFQQGVLGEHRSGLQVAACGTCTATEMCWQGSCTAAPIISFVNASTKITCQVKAVVDAGATKINVVVDQSADAAASASAVTAVEDFAKTLPSELSILGLTSGHSGSLDRDGDGRLTVVFTNREVGYATTDAVGFFDHNDFLATSDDAKATGNTADILWARIPGTSNAGGEITSDLLAGTLAHEYQHLASYAVRVQARGSQARPEVIWLEEGLSHLMEDLTGWGASNIGTVDIALSGWNGGTLGLSEAILKDLSNEKDQQQRGKAFLMLRHMIDRRGSTSLVSELLHDDATGFEHPAFQQDFDEVLWKWQLGVYATGNDEVTGSGAHAFDYAATTTSSVTGQTVGIDTHATYTDARGASIALQGPTVASTSAPELTDLAEAYILSSGTQLFEVSGTAGVATLVGTAPAGDNLFVQAIRIK